MHHEERAKRMIEMLQRALVDLAEDGEQREWGKETVDCFWRSLGGAPDGDPRIVAIVQALENGRAFWASPTFHSVAAGLSSDEKRSRLAALMGSSFAALAPVEPDRAALLRALEQWPNVGSHRRWPAIYELARSIGWGSPTDDDADRRRAIETLKKAIERQIAKRDSELELLEARQRESTK